MKAVILAGGPGTRLWPLSNPQKSKAFQPVIQGDSMLQYTYRQMSRRTKSKDLYVQLPETLVSSALEQLPTIDIDHLVTNPIPKDTLPIILWVVDQLGKDPDEPILIRCVDQYIDEMTETKFLVSLEKCLARYSHVAPALTLLCTKYTVFHPGNGYVVTNDSDAIVAFIEKPSQKTAETLAQQGTIYRNPLMAIISKNTLYDVLKRLDFPWAKTGAHFLEATSEKKRQLFLDMESLSISDTVFQNSPDLRADIVEYDFLDVGTYGALYALNAKDSRGNVVIGKAITGKDCRNNFIVNQTDKPMIVESMNNSVIAQTPLGSLAISMQDADRIKDIYKAFG